MFGSGEVLVLLDKVKRLLPIIINAIRGCKWAMEWTFFTKSDENVVKLHFFFFLFFQFDLEFIQLELGKVMLQEL